MNLREKNLGKLLSFPLMSVVGMAISAAAALAAPAVTITQVQGVNVGSGFHRALSNVKGTSSTTATSVSSVALSIKRNSDGKYWNFTPGSLGFNLATETFPANSVATLSGPVNARDWVRNTNMPSGAANGVVDGASFTVRARVTDNTNATAFDSATFTLDTINPPVPTFTTPAASSFNPGSAFPNISGTATDARSGVGSEQIEIKQTRGLNAGSYWNGTAFQVAQVKIPATGVTVGATSTSFGLSASLPTENGYYDITVTTIDRAGNQSTTVLHQDVCYDNIAPKILSSVLPPRSSATTFPTMSGSVDDGPFGSDFHATQSVTLEVFRVTSGTFWNGTKYVPASDPTRKLYAAVNTAVSPRTYTRSANLSGANLTDGIYNITIKAADRAGNVRQFTKQIHFDRTAPTIAITSPSGTFTNSLASIKGTVSDVTTGTGFSNSSNAVSLTIQRGSNGQFWNGSSWQAGSVSLPATVSVGSDVYNGTWKRQGGNPPVVESDGSYTITATATDTTGNTSSTSTLIVAGDTTGPTVTCTSHTANQRIGAFANGIFGTAADANGISSVSVSLLRKSDNTYWNGSAFVASVSTVPSTGTTSWSVASGSLPAPPADPMTPNPSTDLTPGQYQIQIVAIDAGGNKRTLLINIVVVTS